MSSCRMMRRRDAPSDSLMPISRCRAIPRASSKLATLAQPIIRISPKAKKIGEKTINPWSTLTERVPWLGRSLIELKPSAGLAAARSARKDGRSGRPDAQIVSPAVAACGDIPGFSRPATSMAISSSLPA